jgi:hypothetical protein
MMTTSIGSTLALWEDVVMSMFCRNRLTRIISALAWLLLSGCSAVKVAYNNAPTLTYWWMDTEFNFNDSQVPVLKEKLASFHQWHRQQELPQYLDTLRQLQTLMGGPITPTQLCDIYAQGFNHAQRLGDEAAKPMSSLVVTLTPKQLSYFEKQRAKSLQKWREEWLDVSTEDRQKKRLKQVVERAETLYGRLDEAQTALLRQRIQNSVFDPKRTEIERLRRSQDIMAVLQEHAAGKSADRLSHVQAELMALTRRSLRSPDVSYRSYVDDLTRESCESLSELHNTSSPAQRRKALKTLQEYEADLRPLMLPL